MVSPSPGSVAMRRRSRSRGITITSPDFRHPGRHEDAHAGEHVQLAEEAAGPVVGDDLLFSSAGDHHVDRPGHHDHEVVGRVALSIEVLAGGHRPPGAQLVHDRHVGVGQGRKGDCVIGHRRASSGWGECSAGLCELEQLKRERPKTGAPTGALSPFRAGDRTSRSGDQRPGTSPLPGRRGTSSRSVSTSSGSLLRLRCRTHCVAPSPSKVPGCAPRTTPWELGAQGRRGRPGSERPHQREGLRTRGVGSPSRW